MQLQVGKKYRLPHGVGTLLGYELFSDNGMKSRVVEEVHPRGIEFEGRYIFKLDEGHTWGKAFNHLNYAAWTKQIEEI